MKSTGQFEGRAFLSIIMIAASSVRFGPAIGSLVVTIMGWVRVRVRIGEVRNFRSGRGYGFIHSRDHHHEPSRNSPQQLSTRIHRESAQLES